LPKTLGRNVFDELNFGRKATLPKKTLTERTRGHFKLRKKSYY